MIEDRQDMEEEQPGKHYCARCNHYRVSGPGLICPMCRRVTFRRYSKNFPKMKKNK